MASTPPQGGKKRARDRDDAGRPSKLRRVEPQPDQRDLLRKVADTCRKAMKYRQMNWTTYARQAHRLVAHNFGNGLEPAIVCLGCRRLLPTVLITGDHIVPKSDEEALRRAIAEGMDKLDMEIYEFALNVNIASLRSDPSLEDIRAIRAYDNTLRDDVRNIRPLCWYCNAVKGTRQNVRLFPENAILPRRPHEAPF